MDPRDEPTREQARQDGFGRRLLMVVGAFVLAGALVVLLWRTAQVLLMLFAAILATIGVDGLADAVRRRLHLPRGWAVAVVVVLLLLAIAGFVVAVGPQLADQSRQLADLLPRSVDTLIAWLHRQPWGEMLTGDSPLQFLPRAGELLATLVLLTAQLVGGIMFGLIGVFLATPLAMVVIVLVQMLYIQDVLGEPTRVLGDHRANRD